VCKCRATYCWKAIDEGYNFALELISTWGLYVKLWAPKFARVPTFVISKLSLGSPGIKCHLDVGLVDRHRVYYKGEGGGFPQVWAMVSFVSLNCSWFILTPKMLQLCTNHFVLGLYRFVWVVEACQFFLVPFSSSSTPFYPSKCYELKSVPWFLTLSLFLVWTHIWVPQGVGSASFTMLKVDINIFVMHCKSKLTSLSTSCCLLC
jgi:hypothetical protein